MLKTYDVIVVGAGHAGSEAAAAAANLGSSTLLITMDMTKIAQMSCNPAIGGIAKGQIVREIDALGGYTGIVTDKTTIQFRMLNRSKGPAMWSPRAQCDRMMFSLEWRKQLEKIKKLDFFQDKVVDIILEDNMVKGVITQMGFTFKSKTVILTNGTFLNGLIHIGQTQINGGRMAEPSSGGLTEKMFNAGFKTGRMKTGTPARLDGRSIDFSKLVEQKGDDNPGFFSYYNSDNTLEKQRSCFIAHTNPAVHDTLREKFEFSPLFNGTIQSIGPRYCPSIEDKVVTFADKNSHQLFLEPEGFNTEEYYINGFSSSLPWKVQLEALRKIAGLENVQIFRPGYAIEYDYFDPTQLKRTLETKLIENLFFAGQINGTTGYEEAGAQGLIAGINAALKSQNKEAFTLSRDEAYIGVLIDDLITKGVDEPYRMFTSRAEYRILLRQDNADIRLTEKAYNIGLASKERLDRVQYKKKAIDELISYFEETSIRPNDINEYLTSINSSPLKQSYKLINLIGRPDISINALINSFEPLKIFCDQFKSQRNDIIEGAEISMKYQGYLIRERQIAEKIIKLERLNIPKNINYNKFTSISTEARQKLGAIKPETIGQAARIPGISPSDINVLLISFGR
ncbi:MAG: tRNA uridine-5-carboxymethylaminomethyl(34) synthesis enzyme MnmG [Bacteroidetes bacterium HGW-Bacteroidetes-4]|jgi:tRNA uridine 5-carboxymethylaminomethyl modification enzyme|nr:MAG: tRNA uridine-5-carboxymethylaminomethyl(34) synthesis enzyme MnmG [Bacteroidetes bacterium HGW-Bacteroidetes-4]